MSTLRFHSCMKPSVSCDNLEKEDPTILFSQTYRGAEVSSDSSQIIAN